MTLASASKFHVYLLWVNAHLAYSISVLNVKVSTSVYKHFQPGFHRNCENRSFAALWQAVIRFSSIHNPHVYVYNHIAYELPFSSTSCVWRSIKAVSWLSVYNKVWSYMSPVSSPAPGYSDTTALRSSNCVKFQFYPHLPWLVCQLTKPCGSMLDIYESNILSANNVIR